MKGGKYTKEHSLNILFGKYAVINRIGEGGTGDVLLVQHIDMGTFRAVKSIKKSLTSSESFFFEVSILKNLRHPGIPIIYDIEEDNDYFYIIEEYIEGVSLDKYLNEYPELSYIKKIKLLKKICEIVDFLHTQSPNPIVHLDIKPQNIIINPMTEQVYLLDYGNGYILNSNTHKKYVYGTNGYTNALQYENVSSKLILDMYSLAKIIDLILQNNTDNLLITMLDECINNSECTISAKDLCSYFEKKEVGFGFSKEICIVGSKEGIGVTHLALSLTTELNRRNKKAVYVNYNDTSCVPGIMEEKSVSIDTDGVVLIKGSFCRMVPACKSEEVYRYIRIVDMGIAELENVQRYNNIVFLCGAREWEKEQTFSKYKELKAMLNGKNVVNVFNCGREMSIPYIKDPFNLNYMERKKFEKIIKSIKI